ncbi:MAG: hypothetical protein IKU13_06905 [Clostridia bacterium]|nr:hypothetical protein [Clostridia bacterium]
MPLFVNSQIVEKTCGKPVEELWKKIGCGKMLKKGGIIHRGCGNDKPSVHRRWEGISTIPQALILLLKIRIII